MRATTSPSTRCPAPRNAASSRHAAGAPQRRRRDRHFLRHRQQRNQATQVRRCANHRHQFSSRPQRRIDNKQGSELAARHLMMLGHRDIVYIRSDREVTLHFSVQGRYESFMACCQANGVEPPACHRRWQEQDQQGRDAAAQPRPHADGHRLPGGWHCRSVVPEKLRTLDHGRPWSDDQFASTRLSSSRDMSR